MAIYSGFTHRKWWFSIVMLVHQRVVFSVKMDCFFPYPNRIRLLTDRLQVPRHNPLGDTERSATCDPMAVMGTAWRRGLQIYPLVMTNSSPWKITIYSGFSHWKWWFSIVMLVYQRVKPNRCLKFKAEAKMCDFAFMNGEELQTLNIFTYLNYHGVGQLPFLAVPASSARS